MEPTTAALIGCGLAGVVGMVWSFFSRGDFNTIRRKGVKYWWWVDIVGHGIHSSGQRPEWHPTRYCSEEYCGCPPPGQRGWDDRRGDRTLDL